MKNKCFFIFFVAILSACNKYDLEGDKAVFIGNWKWVYSIGKYMDPADGHHIYFTVSPSDFGKSFSMEFRQNGKYLLMENGDVLHREKAKFISWYLDANDKYYFCIDINKDNNLQGYIWGDSLLLLQQSPPFYFPALEEKDLNSLGYTSYFARE